MTRLLIVTTVAPTISGFLLPFAEHFRTRGWTVDAMAHGVENCDACRHNFDHVWEMDWSRHPLAAKNFLSCRARVGRIVEREQYDLVHVHTPVAALVARLALRGLRRRGSVRVIYTAHGFHFHRGRPFYKNSLFQTLEWMAGRWTDRLVVINAEDLEAAKQLRIVPKEHVTHMPGIGVDTDALRPESVSESAIAGIRSELGLAADERYLLVVAELVANKRHVDVLNAAARLKRSGVHVVLAGTGPRRNELRQLSGRLGLDRRVHFLGYRRDIPALMRGCSALLLTSAREGLPRSIMEAMCLAVPVIASDIRGTRDLLADGAGVLIPLGDVGALANAMAAAIDHPVEMTAMGLRARERIANYDIKNVIAMHESLYADVLGRSRERSEFP